MNTVERLAPLRVGKRFWRIAKTHRWFWIGSILTVCIAQSTIIASSFVLKYLIDDATGLNHIEPRNPTLLYYRLIQLAVLWGVMWVAWRTSGLLGAQAQTRTERDLLMEGFSGVTARSYRFFENSFVGALARRIRRYGDAFSTVSEQFLWTLLPTLITVIGSVYAMWTVSSQIAIFVVGWLVVYILANTAFSAWKLPYDERRAEMDTEQTAALADAVTNYNNVILFNGQKCEEDTFYAVSERARKAHILSWYLAEANFGIQSLLLTGMQVGALGYVVWLWADGRATIGDLALVNTVFNTLNSNLWEIGRLLRHIFEAAGNAKEIVDTLEEPVEVQDAKRPKKLDAGTGGVTFKDVEFTYGNNHVLQQFSCDIRPGERIALVGPSGAGKSTVVKLLLRLYDVTSGTILINGADIRNVTQETLRHSISLVPQDPVLFHRTIKENIRYAKPEATDEEIVNAATLARCDEFITKLPEGYDTYVGERGVKLSGGERQRIAIARAILRESPVLVLDEATSSLDSMSETLIQEALTEVMKKKTTIVIAHRLSTIMQMDRILVVDGGRIVDQGTHEELSKRSGIYKELWDIQVHGYQKG